MALPRRCTHCKCYIANWLTHCPRCNKIAPAIIQSAGRPSAEERDEEREKRDAKLPHLHGKNIHWKPSQFSIDQQTLMLDEVRERIERSDTAGERNALRSELRLIKATLAKAERPHCWTYEVHPGKHESFFIYISPKGRRYVLSTRDGPADLIIENKRSAAFPVTRLQRFENSRYARLLKDSAQEEHAQTQRKKARKAKRITEAERMQQESDAAKRWAKRNPAEAKRIRKVEKATQPTLSLGDSDNDAVVNGKRARGSATGSKNSRTNARTRKREISKSRSR